ncbi:MAG: hypothetical protein H7Y08_12760 [Rhizobiaceae bacterium]|nr:hypothetical protein [Rhizobiaceae bacterium]
MSRLPSTVALAGWFGFVLTSIILASNGAGSEIATLEFATADLTAAMAYAALLVWQAASAAAMAWALYCLHDTGRERRRFGEQLGLAGLFALAVHGGLGLVVGIDPVAAQSAGYWVMLVLAALALLFDRLVAVEEDAGDDKENFEAAVAVIAQSMARQTELYTDPSHRFPPRAR